MPDLFKKSLIGLSAGFLVAAALLVAGAFADPTGSPADEFTGPESATSTGYWTAYGRGWVPNSSLSTIALG